MITKGSYMRVTIDSEDFNEVVGTFYEDGDGWALAEITINGKDVLNFATSDLTTKLIEALHDDLYWRDS